MSPPPELTYGGVLLAVLAQQLCLPVPSVVVLMGAGALSAHGRMSPGVIVAAAVLACLAGDGVWFWVGRRWGSRAMRLLCRFAPDPRSCSENAREKFRRHGLRILCVSKFLPGLDAVMPPLGGAEGVSPASFLAVDTIGSLLWAGAYVGLGYVFANQLNAAIRWVGNFGVAAGFAVGIPVALYAGSRGLALLRMIRHLRLRRMTAPMLARKLRANAKIAVLDLATFEVDDDGDKIEAIPGAFSLDPSLLRHSPAIFVPRDVKIVLYCSSGSDIVSARVAMELKRIGVDGVWVLEGGLKAWREQGFPVSHYLEVPEVVAGRLGVQLPRRIPGPERSTRRGSSEKERKAHEFN
jgi:membrane protein DedA with SNARE-associated domain/rhodanese-related sulfurtransferase